MVSFHHSLVPLNPEVLFEAPPAPSSSDCPPRRNSYTRSREDFLETTKIGFRKMYYVMEELFHTALAHQLPHGFSFLDIGAAPGGASQYLLNMPECACGFGMTLPVPDGGFPIAVRSQGRYQIHFGDLLESPDRTWIAETTGPVHLVFADAQLLKKSRQRHWPRSDQEARTCLLTSQVLNGLWNLAPGGTFVIRLYAYGSDMCRNETRLIFLLMQHFETVRPFKSATYHAADLSFYLVCSGFKGDLFWQETVFDRMLKSYRTYHRMCTHPQLLALRDKMVRKALPPTTLLEGTPGPHKTAGEDVEKGAKSGASESKNLLTSSTPGKVTKTPLKPKRLSQMKNKSSTSSDVDAGETSNTDEGGALENDSTTACSGSGENLVEAVAVETDLVLVMRPRAYSDPPDSCKKEKSSVSKIGGTSSTLMKADELQEKEQGVEQVLDDAAEEQDSASTAVSSGVPTSSPPVASEEKSQEQFLAAHQEEPAAAASMSPPRPCHLDFAEPSPHPVVRDESKLKEKKRLSWAALTLDDSGDDTDAMKDHGVSLRTSAKAADNNRVLRKTPCSSSTTAKKHLELEVDPVLEEEKANGSTSAGGEAQPSASPSTTSILKKKEQEVVGTSKSSDGGDGILDEEEPGVAVSTEPPAVWTNPDDEEWLEVAEVCASLGITEQEFWHLAGFPEPAVHSSSNNVDQGNNAAQEHVAADQNVVQEGPQSQESSMPHLSGNEDTSRDSSMYALCGSGSTVPLLSSSRNDVLNHGAGPSSSTLASTIGQEELQACSSVPLFATSEEDSSLIPLAMPVGSVKDKEDSSSLTPQEQAGQQDPSLSAGGQSVTLQLPDGSTCEFLVPAPTAAALPGQIEEEPISWDVAWFGPYSVQKQSATATKCSGGGFRPALGQSSESTSSASLKSMSVKEVAAKIMGEEAPESTPQVEQNDPSYVPNTRHLWAQRDTADAPGVIAPLGRQEEESEVIPMVGEQTAGTNLAESESVPADTSGEAQQQLSNADVEKRELVTKADDPQAEKQGVQVGRSYFRMDLGRTTYAPEPELFRDFFEQEQETEYLQRLEKIIAYVIRFAQAHAGPRHYN